MDPALILLTLIALIINGVSFYFGFYRPAKPGDWLHQAGFIMITFLIIPFSAYTLYTQVSSIRLLEEFGIPRHPSITHAIGIGNGRGENPNWVLALNDGSEDILSFYESGVVNPAWTLEESNDLYLRYATGGGTVTIAHLKQRGKNQLIITSHNRL
jgi:hypothetical protein